MQRSVGPCLWIIRHGRAEPSSASGLDRDRSLDDQGLQQALWLAQTLARDPARPEVIVASPAVRTWTTAGTIAATLGVTPLPCDELTCEHRLSDALQALVRTTEVAPGSHMAIVGHNPTLSELLSWLVTGVGQAEVHIRTGEAVQIELNRAEPFGQPGSAEIIKFCRHG